MFSFSDIHVVTASTNSSEAKYGTSKATFSDDLNRKIVSYGTRLCTDCKRSRVSFPTKDINSTKEAAPYSLDLKHNDKPINRIISDESEKIVFSRKYSPQVGKDDGFVPVPGPYGMKSSFSRDKSLKPAVSTYNTGAAARNVNSAYKNSHVKNHTPRHVKTIKSPQPTHNVKSHESQRNAKHLQNMQRRAQYRQPKIHEDHSEKEDIANENILGNGNFEIIRGGIFSDQDANEIVGSRRMSRGYSPFVAPTYHQRRFNVVQFPPIYQERVQVPFNPVYYPRPPY